MFFGLGLLICVPSALFLLHGCRILDGLKAEIRDGRRWVPPLLAAGAIALGPALLTAQILRDRVALHQALDHLQYPDYTRPVFTGDRAALRAALINLRDFKEGRYLPIYSEFYNWLAFDNLLLPDKKLAETWTAFFGDTMPKSGPAAFQGPFFSLQRGRTNSEILNEPPGERPAANAVTESLRTVVTPQPGEVRARAQLVVENPTETATEYRALVHVPDGVFVRGMTLKIGEELVPARLFEERAALWVYSKITEVRPVRRDPAILRYTAPQTAELRIFPVEPHQTRTVELEFSYPDNLAPAITVDGHPLDLPQPQTHGALRTADTAWVPPSALDGVAPLRRTAQPWLIIDTSKNSALQNPSALTHAIRNALSAFPHSAMARVTFANFESRDFDQGHTVSVRALRDMAPGALLKSAGKFEGGFLEALAIKSALVRAQADHATSQYPDVIVLRGADTTLDLGRNQLPQFAALLPDAPFISILDPGASSPRREPLDPMDAGAAAPREVRVFQTSAGIAVTSATDTAFLTGLRGDALSVYDPAKQSFTNVSTRQLDNDNTAATRWTLVNERLFHPSTAGPDSLSRLLQSARTASVLVPSTALMVVENQAQWKILERTEKKTQKAHEALAMQEPVATPEPGVIGLLLAGGLAWLIWRRFQRPSAALPA